MSEGQDGPRAWQSSGKIVLGREEEVNGGRINLGRKRKVGEIVLGGEQKTSEGQTNRGSKYRIEKNVLEEEKEASVGQTKPERSGYIGRIVFDKWM